MVAAILIGVAASTIALRNWQTAAQKLKLDFYKPRFDIYSATADYLNFLISSKPSVASIELNKSSKSSVTSIEFNKFVDQIRPADWLFNSDSELLKMLQTIKDNATEKAFGEANLAKQTEFTIEYNLTLTALGKIAVSLQDLRENELKERFGKYLSLTNYSWSDSLVARMRRRKVATSARPVTPRPVL